MNKRIADFLKNEQISSAQFAERLGIQRSRLSHILSGRNKPNIEFIQKMLQEYTEINPEWLILGKGNMYLIKKPKTVENDSLSLFSTSEVIPKNKSNRISERKIKRIVFFYDDKSFENYFPDDS